ncbi:hypothetical protein Tco_0300516 [Tanacetum coccineum]
MSSSSKSSRDYSRKHEKAILEPWRQSHNLPPSPPSPSPKGPTPTSPISTNSFSSSSPPQNSTQNLNELHHLSNLLDINLQQAIKATHPSPPASPCIPPPSLDQVGDRGGEVFRSEFELQVGFHFTSDNNHWSALDTRRAGRDIPFERLIPIDKVGTVLEASNHGFIGYPFDYRVTPGFGSITGGLDHVNPVIRLPLEYEISRASTLLSKVARETSSRNVSNNNNTDGLAVIISKLDNLGHDMKKLKENVYTIQVRCQICKGPHLNKQCPLNEEVKQLEEVKYREFKRSTPFNGSNEAKFYVGKSYTEWYKENSHDNKPMPRDYTFREWMIVKVGHTNVNKSVKKALLKSWVIDCFEEALDPDKDPMERSFDDYIWVFDLEIEQLADEYEL